MVVNFGEESRGEEGVRGERNYLTNDTENCNKQIYVRGEICSVVTFYRDFSLSVVPSKRKVYSVYVIVNLSVNNTKIFYVMLDMSITRY